MIDPDTQRFIIKEIEKRMNLITGGQAGANTETTQNIDNVYAGHPTMEERPIMHPYGMVSRAPRGTLAVTAQQGSHPGNKMTLGHRNAKPPTVAEGESALYSRDGFTFKVENGQILFGKSGDFETVAVGDTLKTLLIAIIDAIIAHDHLGNLGYPTSTVRIPTPFTDAKANFLENDKILAKDDGRF